jgi:IS5 family transposase
MGLATRTTLVDTTRTAKAHASNANLRRRIEDKLAVVRRINGELAELAERVARQADAVTRNARRKLATLGQQAPGRARAAVEVLQRTVELTRRVAAQTRQRLAGQIPDGATPVVSLHDAPDADQPAPAIRRIKRRTGRAPRTVVADRGYGEAAVENELRDEGIRNPVLPRQGRPTAPRRQIENRRAFRRHVRWRTGSEGRISCLKRDCTLNRTRLDGINGARTWCGHSIFVHDLITISGLTVQPASSTTGHPIGVRRAENPGTKHSNGPSDAPASSGRRN